jgi:predicted nucleotidyltransferase
MITLIKDNLDNIKELCKRHHVKFFYVFGSAVNQDLFNQNSDIDFLYEIDIEKFKKWDVGDYDYIDNLDDLEADLNTLLLRKIDLVPYENIQNRFFKQSVDNTRELLYVNQ